MKRRQFLGALSLAPLVHRAQAQERFSLFVASDPKNVERMVRIAALRDNDVVIDLGSGDGRVVIAAAQANPTVRGYGVDIDAKLVQQATANAEAAGVGDRVEFQWIATNHGPAITSFKVLKKASKDGE